MTEQHQPINGIPKSATGESASPVSYDLNTFITEDIRQKRQADEAARHEPALRLAMVELVGVIGELIENAAARLAAQRGNDSQFEADRAGDDLYHRTSENCAFTI